MNDGARPDSRILKAKSENARAAGGLLKEGVSRVEVEMESGGAKEKHQNDQQEGTMQGYIET